jgi:hypothetical protein
MNTTKKYSRVQENHVALVGGSPTNNVGDGEIAGLGIGPQGEPGVKKRKKLASFISYISRNQK